MDKYLKSKLIEFLKFEIPKDMIDHILSLNNEQAVRNYFSELLDKSDPKQRQFINEFIGKRNLKATNFKKKDKKRNKDKEPELYEIKSNLDELEKQYQIPGKRDKENKSNNELKKIPNISSTLEDDDQITYESPYQKYKKINFSAFNFNDDEYPVLPGRRFCGCFAKRHKLVNNCMKCGRLQCEQEGSGPCMFCSTLVVNQEEREILEDESPEAEALLAKLLNQPKPKGWKQAVERQKTLRDADLTRKERQKIIDDQTDYFTITSSTWNLGDKEQGLSDIAKQIMENTKRDAFLKSQPKTKLSIINDKNKSKVDLKLVSNSIENLKIPLGIRFDDKWRSDTARDLGFICPIAKIDKELEDFLEKLPEMRMPDLREKLFYRDPRSLSYYPGEDEDDPSESYDWKNEFWELNEYFDRLGFCISIRQPYASLIMSGIKTHEGRSWKLDLRGILWIASASYEPSKDEIDTVENFYRRKYGDKNLTFPKKYPTGRLLGRVQIENCLNQEEYLQDYPNGEVDSDWVFIFNEIIPLPIAFPMKGYNGIYLLPKKLHTAAGLLIRKLIREKPELVEL